MKNLKMLIVKWRNEAVKLEELAQKEDYYKDNSAAKAAYTLMACAEDLDRHLTNAIHSDAQKQCPSCVDADLVNVPTCPKCGYYERR